MGMFDTIEIEKDIPNGPEAGEYQSKDLDCLMDYYTIDSNRLYKKVYKYHPVPKEKQKHILHLLESEYVGLLDINFHGWVEIYGAYETWKLKFTDGELKECKMTESLPRPQEKQDQDKDKITSKITYWSGDGYEYEIDEEEEDGY
jgi:hypothetical protein